MKARLNYTVRTTRAPGESGDSVVPVIVERLSPVDLETVVENCIDRGLVAGIKPTAAHGIAEGVAAETAVRTRRRPCMPPPRQRNPNPLPNQKGTPSNEKRFLFPRRRSACVRVRRGPFRR